MTIRNARSLKPIELMERRKQAVALYKSGMNRIEISRIVNAHRNVVGQWIKAWKEDGDSSFEVKNPGRSKGSGCRLTGVQASAIKRLITDNNPDQLKFSFALWTREAIKLLILERFEIDIPIRTIGDYLKRWGFTVQKPKKRAYERNDRAIQRWLNEEYPAIAKRAKKEGAEIQWGDETGIRSDDVQGRGYAPKGKTPVVKRKGCRERISMLSTVTNRGKLRFTIYKGSINSDLLIKFMKRLVTSNDKKVFLILDNLKVHHSRQIKDWLEKNSEFIEVFFLPSYSPELNPDEYLNSDFKREVRKLPDSRAKGTLEKNVRSVMHRIQKQPNRIVKYFQAEEVLYAA